MKKILLLAGIALASQINAQILESENFNAFTVGNLGTQGGFTTLGGTAADYQILSIDAAHGNSLQIAGAAAATGTKYVYKTGGLGTPWTNRTAGNNVLKVSAEFYTGAQAGTGAGTQRSVVYNSTTTTMVGIAYDYATKTIKGIARVSINGTVGNYIFGLGTETYDVNTWVPVSYTYDYTTGTVTWTYPGGTYYLQAGTSGTSTYVMTPSVNPNEQDFMSTLATGNTISHINAYDNYSVQAVASNGLSLAAHDVTSVRKDISVYPNPTSDFLNISADGKVKSVQIFDLSGKIVKSTSSNNKVDVRDLAKGNYIIKVVTDNDAVSHKFIKK